MGINDLKTRTQNIENLFSGGPRAIGVVGETHMFALIQEILSEAQYIKNQKINNDTVECAIKIKETLCPCDSYFGTRELDKINKAITENNKENLIEARKEFGKALVRKAREVKQKYISPPTTTPFAVVYLPSEGAFIEAIKLKDANDESSLVKEIKADNIDYHIEAYAKGRMKKKLLGAKEAIEGGVKSVILGDARSESPVTASFNGQGTMTYANGNKFVGEFKNDYI